MAQCGRYEPLINLKVPHFQRRAQIKTAYIIKFRLEIRLAVLGWFKKVDELTEIMNKRNSLQENFRLSGNKVQEGVRCMMQVISQDKKALYKIFETMFLYGQIIVKLQY